MKWPINRKKVDEVIEVLPSKNETYIKSADEILDQIQNGEVKAADGEGLMMAVVKNDGNVKLAGYGNKEQVISVAFNLIMQAAGIAPNVHETGTEEAPAEH